MKRLVILSVLSAFVVKFFPRKPSINEKHAFRQYLLIFLLANFTTTYSQSDSLRFTGSEKTLQPKRLAFVISSEAALYGGLMVGLNTLWYKDFPKSKFHFFNDNKEWLQLDKVGHATTAYYVGKLGINVMDWTGMKHRNAIIWGGSLGSIFLTTIEIVDGYSVGWGFSKGDMLANISGAAMFATQQHFWGQQKITLRVSAKFSPYAKYNPKLLQAPKPTKQI